MNCVFEIVADMKSKNYNTDVVEHPFLNAEHPTPSLYDAYLPLNFDSRKGIFSYLFNITLPDP